MCYKGVMLFMLLLGYCPIVVPACTFPSELQSAQWISSLTDVTKTNTYSTLTFTTSNLTIDFYSANESTYSCFRTDGGNKILLRSSLLTIFTYNVYRYLCFDFRRQNSYSYAFYVLSNSNSASQYYQHFVDNYSVSIENACNNTKTEGEYYVIIRKTFETFAKQTCIVPLLGVFYYSQRENSVTCASGKWDICNSNSTQIYTTRTSPSTCFVNPGAINTATGYSSCVASVSGTYYYQTTYYANTQTFFCMTVGYSGINVTVTLVARSCEYAQTPTYVSNAGTYFNLVVNDTCVPSAANSSNGQTNVGLIVGIVVGVIILLVILCGILWYKHYLVKKKKANITRITENRKKKFQDPFMEENDKKSTITRDDIIFDIENDDRITPIAPNITTEGDTHDEVTNVANGHAATQGNGHVPDNVNTMEGTSSVLPFMGDIAPMDDSSENKRPEKFKSFDMDLQESTSDIPIINEAKDEKMPPATMTTKTTNIFANVPESLTPVSGEI